MFVFDLFFCDDDDDVDVDDNGGVDLIVYTSSKTWLWSLNRPIEMMAIFVSIAVDTSIISLVWFGLD